MSQNLRTTKFICDEGIVLATSALGEADKILTILAKNHGKLEILAKNIKKFDSRRAPACDILCHSKFSITKNKVDALSEVYGISQFAKIKSNLEKLSQSFIALEVLNLVTPVGVPNPTIFAALLEFCQKLEKVVTLHEARIARASFCVELLTEAGWLGKDFKIANFSRFDSLDHFLISKFEAISQKRLKSAEFAMMIVGAYQ